MNNQTIFSFPGLGIDWYALNKIAFSIGNLQIRWYGIIITCGIVLAFFYAYLRGKKNEGVIFDDIVDIGLLTVILGIVGARAYYVLTTLGEGRYKSFLDVIAIWEGGLAIYGGIIGGCIGILIMCRVKKIRWQKIFDMVAPGVMIAQAMGRWGNFFNGEAYGYAIGDTTKFYFFNAEHTIASGEGTLFHTLRMGLFNGFYEVYYHPTFLYESIWNIVGFVLINLFYKHKKFDGQIALSYFAWYGFGRMFIEGLRTDSLYIPGTTLRISQCLGLFFFVASIALIIVFSILKRNDPSPLLAADATHDAATDAAPTEADTLDAPVSIENAEEADEAEEAEKNDSNEEECIASDAAEDGTDQTEEENDTITEEEKHGKAD